MSKHDRARREKDERNAKYADKYRQRKCGDCGHRSARDGRCRVCGGALNKRTDRR